MAGFAPRVTTKLLVFMFQRIVQVALACRNRTLSDDLIRGCRNLCHPKAAPCQPRQMQAENQSANDPIGNLAKNCKCEPAVTSVAPKLDGKGNAPGVRLIMKAERRANQGCRSRSGTKTRRSALAPSRSGAVQHVFPISNDLLGQPLWRQNRNNAGFVELTRLPFAVHVPLRWAATAAKRRRGLCGRVTWPTLGDSFRPRL